MSPTDVPSSSVRSPSVRFPGIVIGLTFIGLVAIAFSIAIIQIESGVAAYLAGESIWSRGQVEAVRNLNVYAETGDPEELRKARYWYRIPIGDLEARKAMELAEMDYALARDGFLQGRNHPDDIPRMVLLFRLFNDYPYFREAIDAWRASDESLLALGDIMQELNTLWQKNRTLTPDVRELHRRLEQVSVDLASHAAAFREAMSQASRALSTILSFASVVFFLLLIVLAVVLILRLTKAIRASERNFRLTFERAAVGIVQVGEQGLLLEVNDAMCSLLAYSREDLLTLHYNDLIYVDDKHVGRDERIALERGKIDSTTITQRLRRSDGSLVWTKITMSRLARTEKDGQRFIGILEDVSEAHHLSEKLTHQAGHDDLTGLINRRAFEAYLSEALQRARSENFVHALCFIDLDQFKVVNDTSGHFVGDELLRQVAEELSRHLRKGDLLARLGGDEFGLILDCCEPDRAVKIAEKLRESLIATSFVWEDKHFNIGCSIGIVPISADSVSTMELMKTADSACNMVKEKGRNGVMLALEGDAELAARRKQMEWLDRIRTAVDSDGLMLDVQRIVANDQPGRMRYEVLVRMPGDDGEIVPPGAFLPAVERFGLASLLDRWVVEQVCQRLAALPEHVDGLEACHINLMGGSFDDAGFADFVIETLAKYKVAGGKICFEISEQAAIRNLADVKRFMNKLRLEGCTFAIDDFGTGLSSFGYIKQLPVDFLKIDGAFVTNMASDDTDLAMVRAINDIGQTLNKKMIAEFVEGQACLDLLQDMGVEYVQGFHLHSPERFCEWLKDTSGFKL